jgi:hypothetical protein
VCDYICDGSKDPDGNRLQYHWRQDAFPDDHKGDAKISHAEARTTEVIFACRPGRTVHVLLTVADDGTPNLHAYRRVIIHVAP